MGKKIEATTCVGLFLPPLHVSACIQLAWPAHVFAFGVAAFFLFGHCASVHAAASCEFFLC
jgi:hypothetical protein